ncbi:hypothetical protein C2U72_22735 [Prosthecomicrobium hirschii]|nr:hypothetical protein C2U72_22735 [Prosthecomicrobium hirschii]
MSEVGGGSGGAGSPVWGAGARRRTAGQEFPSGW